MGFKTVWHEGAALTVCDCAMEQLSLTQNQSISEAQMWKCIELNAAALVANVMIRNAATGETKSPNLIQLERTLLNLREK